MDLHDAIRAAYQGRATQGEIATALGTDQPTVSRWARGVNRPSFEDLAALEDASGRPRGWVLRQVGLVVDAISTEESIANDPHLDDAARDAVRTVYGALAKPLTGERLNGGQDRP